MLKIIENDDDEIDTSPLEQKELNGWIGLGTSLYPLSLIALAILLPILIQSLEADNAVQTGNRSLKCDTTGTFACEIKVGGLYMDLSVPILAAGALSIILQIFAFLALGTLADYGENRKKFVFWSSYALCFFGVSFLVIVDSKLWWLALLLSIFANVCAGLAYLFFVSFLPILTRFDSRVIAARHDPNVSLEDECLLSDNVGNSISQKGVIYPSLTSLLALVFVGVFGAAVGKDAFGMPVNYFMNISCAILAIFGFIGAYFYALPRFKARSGPQRSKQDSYFVLTKRGLHQSFSETRRLPEFIKFVVAWFMFYDGITTLTSIGILFAQTQMGASTTILLLSAMFVPLFSIIGIPIWNWFQRITKWSSKSVLMLQLSLYLILPLWAIVGFFNDDVGLRQQSEILFYSAYLGFLFGASISATRVLFAEYEFFNIRLIPKGHEAQFYAIFEISARLGAWIGPLLVAILTLFTSDLRYGFILVAALFTLPAFLFWKTDLVKGRKDAIEFKKVMGLERQSSVDTLSVVASVDTSVEP